MVKNKIIFIVGPTAVGKTDVAFWLAKKLKTQIVSCDAMQVYKEVSILTGKPSQRMLLDIKHYLINDVSVTKNFDVFTFRKKAIRAIRLIEKQKTIPIVVGGSGLYMSVLLDGIFEEEGHGRNLEIRKKIEQDIRKKGKEKIFSYLKKIDPISAAKIHMNDIRRIVRALEVFEVYGKPISALHPNREGISDKYDVFVFALNRQREKLYEKINKRVDKMFKAGVVAEIKKIKQRKISQTAQGIIGLKETLAVIDKQCDLDEVKEEIKKNTRRFAKRQLTWFRRDKRIRWIDVKEEDTAKSIGEKILKQVV